MAMTYEKATDLLQKQTFLISSDSGQWASFLSSACRFTAYDFCNQIMIVSQRNDPTAVASYKFWNDKQECAVIKGRKGIAIFDSKSGGLRYVFDAKDVREIHDKTHDGHKPILWKYEERHRDAVISHLQNKFGTDTVGTDMDIKRAIKNCVGDEVVSYMAEHPDADPEIYDLIYESAVYLIQSRMGLAPDASDFRSFENISKYALQSENISLIGGTVQKISLDCLRDIGQVISEYNREHLAELGGIESLISDSKDLADKFIEQMENKGKLGLANAPESVHNAVNQSRVKEDNVNEESGERTDVHESGRLSVPEHHNGTASGGAASEIRADEIGISDREEILGTRSADKEGTASTSLPGDSAPGRSENGGTDSRTSESRGDNRGDEGQRSHEVGSSSGNGTVTGGGNRPERDHLQLEFHGEEPKYEQLSLFAPSEMEQIGSIMAAGSHSYEAMPEGHSISLDSLKDILRSGTNMKLSRSNIWFQYSIGKSPEEITEILKTEYEKCGKGFTIDGHHISMFADAEGIHFGFGESGYENPVSIRTGAGRGDVIHGVLSYEDAESIIRGMIREGDYLSETEAYFAQDALYQDMADAMSLYTRDLGAAGKLFEGDDKYIYPERKDSYVNALSTPEGRQEVLDNLNRIKTGMENGEIKQRFRYIHGVDYYIGKVSDLMRDRVNLPAKKEVSYPEVDFITQDEIDGVICRGGSYSNSTFRIFEYFYEDHSLNEKAEFLKKEHGIGGFSPAIPATWHSYCDHDSKGVTIKKGDIFNPFSNVTLSYTALAKRVTALVKEDKYLGAKQQENYAAWKEEQAQKALEQAQKELDIAKKEACKNALEDVFQASVKAMQTEDRAFSFGDSFDAVVKEHGEDTVSFVLANTVLRHTSSLKFNPEYVETAEGLLPERSSDYLDSLYTQTCMYAQPRQEDGDYDYSYDADYDYFTEVVNQMCDRFFGKELEIAQEEPEKDSAIVQDAEQALVWNIVHDADDDDEPTEWSAKIAEGEFIWIDDEGDGFAVFDNDGQIPLKTLPSLEQAKEWAADFIANKSISQRTFDYGVSIGNDEEVAFASAKPYYDIWDYAAKDFVRDENGKMLTFDTEEEANAYVEILRGNVQILPVENVLQKDIGSVEESSAELSTPEEELHKEVTDKDIEGFIARRDAIDAVYMSDFSVDLETTVEKMHKNRDDFCIEFSLSEDELDNLVYDYIARKKKEAEKAPEKTGAEESYDAVLKTKTAQAEGYVREIKNILSQKDADWEDKYQVWNDVFGTVLLFDKEKHEEIIGYDNVKNYIQYLDTELPSQEQAKDYIIRDEKLGAGTSKEKFRNNVLAIETLKKLEKENRDATSEEQAALSRYVGWGGLSDAFDESKDSWAEEYWQLKELLTDEEYNAAKKSTLDAFYTSPAIIAQIYHKLMDMGFEGGKILEPSCGVGNFFGCMPEKLHNNSSLTGVEIDSISGRIASKLYPSANINQTGYEDTAFANDTFDLAIGNVPFGDFKVFDRDYSKENFLIHDYFFAKTLDKLRAGGVMAFITSKGTMDKQSDEVRKYLAERAEFLGAVRLPDTAFKANAGTEVTSDIIFLKKREEPITLDENNLPEWCQLGEDSNGIIQNMFFVNHPENIVGKMVMESGRFGPVSACKYDNDIIPFNAALRNALAVGVHGSMEKGLAQIVTENNRQTEVKEAPADMRNFSYAVVDGALYYKNNNILEEVKEKPDTVERIKSMCEIRDTVHALLNCQLEDHFDEQKFESLQKGLNDQYDTFAKKYGRIASRTNKKAFEDDSAYCLLRSLEKYDDDGNYTGKAAIFNKRTVRPKIAITSCDTALDALSASLGEKGKIDFDYMQSLLKDKSIDEIKDDLSGIIFQNPLTKQYESAEEYLSGNVRKKLQYAEEMVSHGHEEYAVNVKALKEVQPEPIKAADIAVRLGATWIEPEYIQQFMAETFQIPGYQMRSYGSSLSAVGVSENSYTNEWTVRGKSLVHNALVNSTYGTSRRNALTILEDSLNLKDSRVYDHETDPVTGKEKSTLNSKETLLAQQKQELLKEKFCDWIFADPERREKLVNKYNEMFNNTRPRTYDGSHLTFNGIANGIELKPHQADAVARILFGGNTLLAHAVGAGKTFEMAAAAMESKRLGLCHKSLFVVPNHITEQWGSEFMKLYPNANILVATKKDFEPARRKEFCSRIATGDYDAVIIGHSQFEKIPLSKERKMELQQKQLEEIKKCIQQTAITEGKSSPSIKQLEKTARSIETKLKELGDAPKDDVVTFEQMGIDRLFVDESHNYKNLYLYTKMRNVAGISTTEAKKSSDLYDKCQYLDEITGFKGIVFASGTPISNSMTELYTNMRYLQRDKLIDMGLQNFDAWASTFGETQTAMELTPEGKGYKPKTRFAKFFNLPELMNVFKECADVRTSDMLNLDVPEAEYIDVVTEPTAFQRDILNSFVERAEKVRARMVDPSDDNMLKITNDGRMMALDQRLINQSLPDDPNSKVNTCVNNAFQIWEETSADRLTQILFCDLSTPHKDQFNVYDDIKQKLIAKGVPEKEIAFIHDADTETKKAALFSKVRSGEVRFILGSTAKLGAGTNIQHKLVALHHLDVPWRPADIEQQEGRIIRQHNQNKKVKIFRYITKDTFDAYSWQTIENKQKFIGQIMTSKSPVRMADDVDEQALNYAEIKALATGNPLIKEKMDLDLQVNKLKMMKSAYNSVKFDLQDSISKKIPERIAILESRIAGFKADIESYTKNKELMISNAVQNTLEGVEDTDKEPFTITFGGTVFHDKTEAGTKLIEMCSNLPSANVPYDVGEYCGFKLSVTFDSMNKTFAMGIKGELSHNITLSNSATGNMARIKNYLESMDGELKDAERRLETAQNELKVAIEEEKKPFEKEEELQQKSARLIEVNRLLEEQDNPGLREVNTSQLIYNIQYVVNEYLKEGGSPLTKDELVSMCKEKIFDLMAEDTDENQTARKEPGICDNLRNLGDSTIIPKIIAYGQKALKEEEREKPMKLSELLINKDDEVTVWDTDWDMETYFFGTEYNGTEDDWDKSMFEFSKLLDVTEYSEEERSATVDMSGLIERNMDALEKSNLFTDCDMESIMCDMPEILAGQVSEKWLKKFVDVLKDGELKRSMSMGQLQTAAIQKNEQEKTSVDKDDSIKKDDPTR